ncbi:FAR1 DNA binding domain, zinc finger, SWIM-type, MULE transposase domain containing protein [Tanacetum coccineum]
MSVGLEGRCSTTLFIIGVELMTHAFPQYFLLLASIANIVADNLGEVSAKAQINLIEVLRMGTNVNEAKIISGGSVGLRLNQSPNSVNIPNISRSIIPDDSSSSNISVTTSISESYSNPIDVSSATVNDRPRIWIPAVESSLKPSKGHVFVSLNQAYDFYKHYGKLGGFDIKLGTEKNYHGTEVPNIKYFNCTKGGKKVESKYDNHKFDGFSVCNIDKGKGIVVANSVCSVPNKKGKGKFTGDGFSGKGKTIDVSNVSKSDDGFSRKGKNVDASDVSKPNVKMPFRKNTSCKTGCLARMMVRKIEGGMFEVYGFVEEHNHPLVSQEDMQLMISSRELGFSKQQFMLQVANSNVGPVRAFKLMKEMYSGFENVGATATDCKKFRRDLNLFNGDRDAQMVVEKLENLKSIVTAFYGLLPRRRRFIIYIMVFVPFTGIDNHNRSVTFGAGLLSDENVGSSVCNKSNFKEQFCRIVWNERISIDMFEQEWASIMDEFDLVSHKWLCDLYYMRHHWIPTFLLDEDMFGLMRITSRSKSENQYFNRFTNPDLMLLEKDAAELFTLNIFYEIQDEIVASIAKCLLVNVEQMGQFEKYFIRDTEVFYSSSDTMLTCSCKWYELYGLLCHHILYVLRMNNVKEFPREYMLDRWSKSDENVWVDTYAVACESSSDASIHAIRCIFKDIVDRLHMRVNKKDTFFLMLGVTEPERVVIKVPRHSKNKGTGSHTRWKNMDELIQNKPESSKKRRTCFVCGKAEGHNYRTCPRKDEISAANKRTKRVTRSSSINYKQIINSK